MSGINKNADFIRANKANSFFRAPSVLFDRLKELKVIPKTAEEEKFQMLLSRREKDSLKKCLNTTWDIYLAKKRKTERQLRLKQRKLESKKKRMRRIQDKIDSYIDRIEEGNEDLEGVLRISEDRLESIEETIFRLEDEIANLEEKMDEDKFDASVLKYDPNLSPLWSELQNLVYDGVSRARKKYGEYATVPYPGMNNGKNGNNGHDKEDHDVRDSREQ